MDEPAPPARPLVLLLDPRDTSAIALVPIRAGTRVEVRRGDANVYLVAAALIPFGHKIALVPVAAGGPVIKYGEVIGFATCEIRPGQHVHVHNVRSDRARVRDA
ncbi:MAG TPA: UxaA family hydrolase [bacterium]|nr:UxaA family hydrolase [bacterium]